MGPNQEKQTLAQGEECRTIPDSVTVFQSTQVLAGYWLSLYDPFLQEEKIY